MEYKTVGRTGVKVSQLCMGTMSFGDIADKQTSFNMYTRCREEGINFFDTADLYANGRSEEILGECISGHREEVVLTSKVYNPTDEDINARGLSRKHIMQAVEADGVHLGEHDIPLAEVRRIAPEKIIGYTVHNFNELRHAQENGADYVGVGPVFKTVTKTVAAPTLGKAGLQAIIQQSSIPCVAISGINSQNAFTTASCGVTGCCIINDILGDNNPKDKTKQLKRLIQRGHQKKEI